MIGQVAQKCQSLPSCIETGLMRFVKEWPLRDTNRTEPFRTVARTRKPSHLGSFGLDQRGTDSHPRQPTPMLLQKADAMFASPDWTLGVKGLG